MALKGIRVIEMAGLAPAPFCGMVLSDFGARVIRIDKPHSTSFDRLCRGKESVGVNLKKKEGLDVVKRLCQSADVLIEPYRPGVMERLGLGPDVLMAANKRLIYARLTGYGQTGSLAQKAGHDINYIAVSGTLSKLGRKNERPYPPINLVADFAGGGHSCALGIVMALYERSQSGQGQIIDCSMVEGSAYISSFLDVNNETLFNEERGTNRLDGGNAFYDTYQTKDGGYMAVGALEPQFFSNLVKGLGLQESEEVSQHGDQNKLRELFSQIFQTKTRDEWVHVFQDLDACVTPVLSTTEAAQHPHNVENGSFLRGKKEPHLQSGPAPRLSRTPGICQQRPLPNIGQHTLEVLFEFGYSQAEISDLVKSGALFQDTKL